MNNKEHSLLLYLMDALIEAPEKQDLLVNMSYHIVMSEEYEDYLNRLSKTKDLKDTIKTIRERIK